MDQHLREYYSQFHDGTPKGNFHRVIVLHEDPQVRWESISKLVPNLCKGWFELSRLPTKDRIEFTREFWFSKLPYHLKLDEFITGFFDAVDDIGVFITQRTFDDPYEANLVYNLQGDAGFFRGAPPANIENLSEIEKIFPNLILPVDYLAFLQIHNGFWKSTDTTGIIPSTRIGEKYTSFQMMLEEQGPLTTHKGKPVNPKTVIPFYQSFGMPFYQCFWAEWYPENEMGNVYYSGTTKTIFDVESSDPSAESMAFPTFIDWLMFYLEKIE